MATARRDLPEDIGALRAALIAERARAGGGGGGRGGVGGGRGRGGRGEAGRAVARDRGSGDAAVIAQQRLRIEQWGGRLCGRRSGSTARARAQMELASAELESSASE